MNETLRSSAETLTCLLIAMDTDTSIEDCPRRFGYWILHSLLSKRDARDLRQVRGSFSFVDSSETAWTHLAVVQSNWEPKHARKDCWHEDPLVQEVFEATRSGKLSPRLPRINDRRPRLVACTSNTNQAFGVLDTILPPAEGDRIAHEYQVVRTKSNPPFSAIRDLGGVSYFARTVLVDYQGHVAVCKLFRPGYEHHFQTERDSLVVASADGLAPEVYEVGSNWILMEYLEGFRGIKRSRFDMLSANESEKGFNSLERLHELGYVHFDFNPDNVLIHDDGRVRLIDFEHVFPVSQGSPSFMESPVFTGSQFFEHFDIECTLANRRRRQRYITRGPLATYESAWLPKLGVTFDQLSRRSIRNSMLRIATSSRRAGKLAFRQAKDLVKKVVR
jgi:serine/threonine protein kinase